MAVDIAQIADIGILPKGLRRRQSQSNAQIYIDELMEEYTCPICFDEISKCMMTPCGHNFCAACIEECLNRKHICPLCSTKTTADKLIRNVHLDSVLAKLINARRAASQQLVQNLMQKTIQQSVKNAPKITTQSPIAKIFTKYTSQTLVKYENYYQDMLRDHNKTQLKIQEKLRLDLTPIIIPLQIMADNIKKQLKPKIQQPGSNNNNIDNDDNDIKMDDIEGSSLNSRIQELFTGILCVEGNDAQYFVNLRIACDKFIECVKGKQKELLLNNDQINDISNILSSFNTSMELTQKRINKSAKLLFESYEEYMKKTGPDPFLLPVSISIRLRGRSQYWDIKLNSTDRIGNIIDIIRRKFIDLGDPIDKFDNSISLGILRPLGYRDPSSPLEIITNFEKCLSELNIRHGTQIHLLTTFRLKSEAPRPCFTYNYNKNDAKQCDYYRCKTCAFNWVCQACSIQCHKGHNLVPFMMKHTPSYACCYCVKKKKCKILNIKSKKK